MRFFTSLLGLFTVSIAVAHDQIPGAPQTVPIVIEGGTIHVIDGPDIENGQVLFENGKITAVGKNLQLPDRTLQVNASGKHVYPGLIECFALHSLSEPPLP